MSSAVTRLRFTLGGLLGLVALNALGGGIYGLGGAPEVPTQWLEGSPFTDYGVPSLILIAAVGGSCLVAAIAVVAGWPRAHRLAIVASAVLLVWIAAQVAIIGFVSWLQPVMAVTALVLAALARGLAASTARAEGMEGMARQDER